MTHSAFPYVVGSLLYVFQAIDAFRVLVFRIFRVFSARHSPSVSCVRVFLDIDFQGSAICKGYIILSNFPTIKAKRCLDSLHCDVGACGVPLCRCLLETCIPRRFSFQYVCLHGIWLMFVTENPGGMDLVTERVPSRAPRPSSCCLTLSVSFRPLGPL